MRIRKRRNSKKVSARNTLATQRDKAPEFVSENTASLADLQAQLQKPGTNFQNFAALPTYAPQQQAAPLQAKASGGKMQSVMRAIAQSPTRPGQPLPRPIQRKMEGAFGADFSDVRIHQGSQAKSIGAIAYTQGSDIHFQPGKYNPHNPNGQKLLGHELTHVLQQRAGRVSTPQAKGLPINRDSTLETEADRLGAKAAQGETVQVPGVQRIKAQTRFHRQVYAPQIQSKKGLKTAVQCKTSGVVLPSLPSEIVSKKLLKTSDTEKMQKAVDKYNSIDDDDKDYHKQKTILTNIQTTGLNYIQKHGNTEKKANKIKPIRDLVFAAGNELTQVSRQLNLEGDHGIDSRKKRLDSTSNEVINAGMSGYTAATSSISTSAGDMAKAGLSKVQSGDEVTTMAPSLYEQTKMFFNGMKEYLADGQEFSESSNIKSLMANYEKAVDGFPFGSVASLVWSIYKLYDNYSEMSVFKKTGQLLEAKAKAQLENKQSDEDTPNFIEADLSEAVVHGYGKVKRRFLGTVYDVIAKVADIVGKVLTLTGLGSLAGAIISLSKAVLDVLAFALRKFKGIFKLLMGTRGKNRQRSAERIVKAAEARNPLALNLLVDLDPLGKIGRWLGKGSFLDTIDKPKDQYEMYDLLRYMRSYPESYGSIEELTTAVAEKLKSQ